MTTNPQTAKALRSSNERRNRNLPSSGGGYFRLLPYQLSRWMIGKVNREDMWREAAKTISVQADQIPASKSRGGDACCASTDAADMTTRTKLRLFTFYLSTCYFPSALEPGEGAAEGGLPLVRTADGAVILLEGEIERAMLVVGKQGAKAASHTDALLDACRQRNVSVQVVLNDNNISQTTKRLRRVLAGTTSLVIGLIFGLLPAQRAATLDPIAARRSFAVGLGADHALDPTAPQALEELAEPHDLVDTVLWDSPDCDAVDSSLFQQGFV